MIAFVDKQDKVAQIHIIPVGEDGEADGERITIDVPEEIQAVDLLAGWTPDNKIGAVFDKPLEFGLYTVPAEGGRAIVVSHGGSRYKHAFLLMGSEYTSRITKNIGKNDIFLFFKSISYSFDNKFFL